MRIQTRQNRGSVVLVMMVCIILVGVTLASYLHMVSNQNASIMRSMAWNSAIAVAEAGIEEGMAHLNRNFTNRTDDGWTMEGTNVVKEKYIGNNRYKVYVNAFIDPPEIIAKGYVINPKTQTLLANPRIVRVMTTNDALYAKGLVAKGQINLSGNKLKTDSFDSMDLAYSTPEGKYDPAKAKDNGDVATNSDLINVGNAEIYGKAATGPGGLVTWQANGTIGNKAWHDAGNKGAQPGWTSDDMNVQFPDVTDPYAGAPFLPSIPMQNMIIDGVMYSYVLGNGNYKISGSISGSDKKIYVAGNATLLVTGDVGMSGNSVINIATNASLNLYVQGSSTKISGNGVINGAGRASSFQYWGLPSNKYVEFSGNAEIIAAVYAPQAALVLGGGGSTAYDFMGGVVANSAKLNGHFNFHYDESLKMYGPKRGYTIVTWNEASVDEL